MGPSWQWQLLPWRSYLDVHKAPHVAVLRAVPGGIDLVILDAHTGDSISRSTVTLADEAQGFKVCPCIVQMKLATNLNGNRMRLSALSGCSHGPAFSTLDKVTYKRKDLL